MRYIDTTIDTPPEAWLKKAKKFTDKLSAIDGIDNKIAFIKRHQRTWKELESFLKKLSHGKCWYSEAKDCASYWHVDHFRPKSEVKGLNGEKCEGYWWLAFDWKNYRLSGSAINSPKSSIFPVRPGTQRANSPANDINDEYPYLLDPTNAIDPGLLTFDEEGMPKPLCIENGWNKDRVDVSIQILNLRHDSLVQARKITWFECNKMVKEAENLMREIQHTNSITKKATLVLTITKIKEMISEKSPFSMVASACVQTQGIPWLTRMVFN